MDYNDITFGYYFKEGGSNANAVDMELVREEASIVSELARRRAKSASNNLEDLSKLLTSLFYNEDGARDILFWGKNFQQIYEQAYEKAIGRKIQPGLDLNKWNWNAKSRGGQVPFEISREDLFQATESRQKISTNSLTQLLEDVEKIKDQNKDYKKIKPSVKRWITKSENKIKRYLASLELEEGKYKFRSLQDSLNENFRACVARLELLRSRAIQNTLSPTEIGNATEVALELFMNEIAQAGYETKNDLINTFHNQLKGAVARRSGANQENIGVISFGISDTIDYVEKDKDGTPVHKTWLTNYTNNNFKISVQQDVEKKGNIKADVQVQVPTFEGVVENWNFSAKSWGNSKYRGKIGSTDLERSINKILHNAKKEVELLMALQNPEDSYAEVALSLSKLCVYADVVAGFAQQTGYANILVINDRALQQVRVYDIADIIYQSFIGGGSNTFAEIKPPINTSLRSWALWYRRGIVDLEPRHSEGQRSERYIARLRAKLQTMSLQVDLKNWT